jgi:hypothetical protein
MQNIRFQKSLNIREYIYIYMYVCIYILERERERDLEIDKGECKVIKTLGRFMEERSRAFSVSFRVRK